MKLAAQNDLGSYYVSNSVFFRAYGRGLVFMRDRVGDTFFISLVVVYCIILVAIAVH